MEFCGKQFHCVDEGFNDHEPVEIVIRPEDLEITPREQGNASSSGGFPAIPWCTL